MHAPILNGPIVCIVKKSHLLRLRYETFKTENASIKVAPILAFACFMAMFHEQSLITGSHAVFLPTGPLPHSLHRWVMFSEFRILPSLFHAWP